MELSQESRILFAVPWRDIPACPSPWLHVDWSYEDLIPESEL